MAEMTFTFNKVPSSLDELKGLKEADLQSGFKTAALVVLALMNYEKNERLALEMLEFLNGPDSVSEYSKQFYKERLAGKQYKINSFFLGATPENGYTPSMPLTIKVTSTPYSFQEENYGTVYVKSSGADEPRPVKIRKKPSTGQWFFTEIQILSDIRIPKEEDPWA